jgi:hypothetical protein
MIKRLSMAAIMNAGIFAPGRGNNVAVGFPGIRRRTTCARFFFRSNYYKIRYRLTHGGAIVVLYA